MSTHEHDPLQSIRKRSAFTPSAVGQKTKSLTDQVERLRATVGMDSSVWAEILDVSRQDYAEFIAGRKTLSIVSLARLADHLNLTLDSILQGKIDYKIVSARYHGNMSVLPERYQTGAASRKRSSLNLLNATEFLLGWRARALAMRELQVTEATFNNLDDLINLNFNTDLCEYLRKNFSNGNDHLFYQMGAYSVVHNTNSAISVELSKSKNMRKLYSHFIEGIVAQYWERNYTYRLTMLTENSCRIMGTPNADIAESLKLKNPGSHAVCQTKIGIISCVPGYLGMPFSHVEEKTCVHRGDSECTYDVDFEVSARHHDDARNTGKLQTRFA